MQKQFNEKNQKHKNVEAQERWSVISEVRQKKDYQAIVFIGCGLINFD